jgi:hypothetical protein
MMALVGPVTSLVLGGAFDLLCRALAHTARFELTFAVFHLCYLNLVLRGVQPPARIPHGRRAHPARLAGDPLG